jgi:hypothetical protein
VPPPHREPHAPPRREPPLLALAAGGAVRVVDATVRQQRIRNTLSEFHFPKKTRKR